MYDQSLLLAEGRLVNLGKLNVSLFQLNQDQADYVGVPVAGPFKPETYRY